MAKGVIDDYDALGELLVSIEHFLNRLDIYTRVPPTVALTEITVKILVELLSTLALTTRQIKQGKTSKSVFGEVLLPDPVHCREICQEIFRRQGHRGGTQEIR